MNSPASKIGGLLFGAMVLAQLARAGVSAEEAARLNTVLTPVGAERAGNKDGTIPPWEGGITAAPAGYKTGDPRAELFPDEQPRFSVTAENMEQHASTLSQGVKALLKRYPKTFRLDVYPTHRTAALPQWVYDNTFKNATRARLSADGWNVENAYGGVPFPIPKNGAEAMWNHKLPYLGEGTASDAVSYIATAGGKIVQTGRVQTWGLHPYYFRDGSIEAFKGVASMFRLLVTAPAHKAGDQFMTYDWIGRPRDTWQYLPGQRRVRKAPALCCDGPDEVTSGAEYWDEAFGWWGDLNQYGWKLVGKKEMYIPYNTEKLHVKGVRAQQVLMPNHVNPDRVRWELHRVWIVEATLLKGERNVVPKRQFYLDEDNWGVMLHEGWDAQGTLWRVGIAYPFVMAEGPLTNTTSVWSTYNLLGGGYLMTSLTDWGNPSFKFHYKTFNRSDSPAQSRFTPEAMAAEAVR